MKLELKLDSVTALVIINQVSVFMKVEAQYFIFLTQLHYDDVQSAEQNSRFPGRGRTVGAAGSQLSSMNSSESSLQARLLDNSSLNHQSNPVALVTEQQRIDGRYGILYTFLNHFTEFSQMRWNLFLYDIQVISFFFTFVLFVRK